MQNKEILKLENIGKVYSDKTEILSNINLSIYDGEFFVLLGPSGCGKTTLMRIIAGLEQQTSGRVIVDGEDLSYYPPYKRHVNYMFQNYALFPHMNVRKNIAFGLKQDGIKAKEIEERIEEAIKIVKMQDFLGRMPHELSGGQQQRIALARILVKRPKILLLDEPLAALDRKIREHTQIELLNIQKTLGITFIMVTHDQDEAMGMASRIGVMSKGKMLQIDTPYEIYEAPKKRFVAEFVGKMNMFDCKVKSLQGTMVSLTSKYFEEVKVQSDCVVKENQDVVLAIRPEEIDLDADKPSNDNYFLAKVVEICFLGSYSDYFVQLSDETIINVTMETSQKYRSSDLKKGQEVYVSWHSEDGVLILD